MEPDPTHAKLARAIFCGWGLDIVGSCPYIICMVKGHGAPPNMETAMTRQRLFPQWFGPQPNATKLFAIFPDGTESEILTRKSPVSGNSKDFTCKRPDGTTDKNNMLRDLKHYLEQDYPGIRFERRKA